ncbi:MAG: DUF4411 family protein [Bacteroidia bacterium]|jgi:hypothetical protein|nr:DUF4411 family protein [Bacteroidia bacterium]
MPVFVVDSNFFIQAHRATYPLDIATGFWNRVNELSSNGTLISIDKVKHELYDKNDELEKWCKANLPKNFFHDTSVFTAEYAQVVNWANQKRTHYQNAAITEFLDADEADAFLVAFALADKPNRIIVTQETSNPAMKSKIKLPEPCHHFGINYMNTIEMFRHLKVSF